jgi:hypothetical protein
LQALLDLAKDGRRCEKSDVSLIAKCDRYFPESSTITSAEASLRSKSTAKRTDFFLCGFLCEPVAVGPGRLFRMDSRGAAEAFDA